ncbi:MAG: DUF1801 domain-containing protein [bacterium]
MRHPPADVAAYLAAAPAAHRTALLRLRKTILVAAPTATERLSYKVPAFFFGGRTLVSMGSFQRHCSLFGGYLAADMAREYPGVEVVSSTVHFTPARPLPAALVKAIVHARIAQLPAPASSKAKARPKAGASQSGKRAGAAPARRPTKGRRLR